jgi:hypothetical protein
MTFEPTPGSPGPSTDPPAADPPATDSSRRTLRIVLTVLGAIIAVCCIGGVAGGSLLYQSYRDASGPARQATVAYINDVMAEDYRSAYFRLCDKVRSATSEDEYIRIQSAQREIVHYRVVGVSVHRGTGGTVALVTTSMTQDTGAEMTQVFTLVKEGDEWRICE